MIKGQKMNRSESHLRRILITDDEENTRWILCKLMEKEGYKTFQAADGRSALKILKQESVDAVLLDLKLPGEDGMEVLKEAKKFCNGTPIIMITGFGSIDSAVEAVKSGAYDYVIKPFQNEQLVRLIRRALENRGLKQENCQLRSRLEGELSLREAMGSSDRIQGVYADIDLVAPTDFTVVITGETGSGKELVARAVHKLSRRASGPFVPVDCGSIPPTLIESELFGHEKGSFTGAGWTQRGKFEAASGGTLFLDEISNLPMTMHAKLLRSLQEKQIFRVGGTKCINVDIRVVAATNQDLAAMVEANRFRRDLYHRLNEFSLVVPPLRERGEDVVYLANRFLDLANAELKKDVQGFSEEALDALLGYRWPGNVRELRNMIRRAVLMADTLVERQHLGMPASGPPKSTFLFPEIAEDIEKRMSLRQIIRRTVTEVERKILVQTLSRTGGNKAKAARLLQIDYKTIHTKVKGYGISCPIGASGNGH